MVVLGLGFGILIYYSYVNKFSLWFGSLMCFFWGMQDGSVNTLVYCLLGF